MRRPAQLACALLLVSATAAGALPPNLAEATRCQAAALADGQDTRGCAAVLRAPCRAEFEARRMVRYGDCLTALADGYAGHARAVIDARAPMLSRRDSRALAERLLQGTRAARRQCEAAAPAAAPLELAHAARAECRLRYAALLAHMIEFHPRRLIAAGAADS